VSTTAERKDWALVLGASSGFGGAAALELARNGYSVFGVHLDRKSTMANVERLAAEVRAAGAEAVFFNVNAADPEKRDEVLAEIERRTEGGSTGSVRVLLHSLAFGTLKLFVADDEKDEITPAQMAMTLDVMANSLVYWTQGVVRRGLMREGGRIFALTSAGSHRVWKHYGPVSAAKAALEAHVRQLAVELVGRGITANAIQAGVTDTPALRKIPGNDEMIARVLATHPAARLTTPEVVARCMVELARPGTDWMTGNTIRVDGGEDLIG
jgi:NAD(P)-dependent dehydrogenase (short-subunit alcohol dehydrogenase family)